MKRIWTFCASLIVATSFFTSCKDSNTKDDEQPSANQITIRATIGDAFKWIAGEKTAIRVNNGILPASEFIGTPDPYDSRKVYFTGEKLSFSGVHTLYALSPYIPFNATTKEIDLTYPLTQTQKGESISHLMKTNFMWAKAFDITSENLNNSEIVLKELGAMLRFHIVNKSGEACTVQSVTVSEEGEESSLYDQTTLTLANGTVFAKIGTETSAKSILVENGTQIGIDGTFNVYMMIPYSSARIGTNDKMIVNVEVLTASGSTKYCSVEIPYSQEPLNNGIDPGGRYALSIPLSNLSDVVVNVPTAGQLATVLGSRITTMRKMKLTGNINSADFATMNNAMTALVNIDMSAVTVEGNIIPHNAFANNARIQQISLPNSITTIGSKSFYRCTGLAGSLIIPNSVISIGDMAFMGCTSLTGSLTIPNSVTTIGDFTFAQCNGFNGTLTISNSVAKICSYTFVGCSGLTGSLTIPNSVTTIEDGAFSNCSGLTGSLTIPNSVTTIGDGAFIFCSGFNGSLTIPNTVTAIGEAAFRLCTGFIGTLTIPNSVAFIDDEAFLKCNGFTALVLNEGVTSIGRRAFYECDRVSNQVVLPQSITNFGNEIFSLCGKIPSFKVLWTNANNIPAYGSKMIPGQKIYVPSGTKSLYVAKDWPSEQLIEY